MGRFNCKNVVLGKDFCRHQNVQAALSFQPRDMLSAMLRFAERKGNRIGILFGLRRTGKTVLLYQWLSHFPQQQSACITVSKGETFSDVLFDLDRLLDEGFRYVAVDEITACSGFLDGAAILANKYGSWGMKLYITGTDSLSLLLATKHELFDRESTLHTTHIPYAEWSRLLKRDSIDD